MITTLCYTCNSKQIFILPLRIFSALNKHIGFVVEAEIVLLAMAFQCLSSFRGCVQLAVQVIDEPYISMPCVVKGIINFYFDEATYCSASIQETRIRLVNSFFENHLDWYFETAFYRYAFALVANKSYL